MIKHSQGHGPKNNPATELKLYHFKAEENKILNLNIQNQMTKQAKSDPPVFPYLRRAVMNMNCYTNSKSEIVKSLYL